MTTLLAGSGYVGDPAAADLGATVRVAPQAPALTQSAPPGAPGAPVEHAASLPTVALAEAGSASESRADLHVVGVLGEGGMGRVLLARQRSLRREVAVKVPLDEPASAAVDAAMCNEGAITGSLEHPNIVPIHALGRDAQGQPMIVMKRVEGVAWSALLKDPSHPAWSRLRVVAGDRLGAHLEILGAVCNALEYAHSRGVVHRDVKPENVMLGAFGEVYLVDWGIALDRGAVAPDAQGRMVGTPGYMAPEMLDGDPRSAGPWTDVYLLGATLHRVLTGEHRHAAPSLAGALLSAHFSEPVAYGPDVPEELASLCNRATARERAQRPPSARAFSDALAEFQTHRGSVALCEAAARSLAALESSAGAGAPAPDASAEARLQRAMTECRFGYLQALTAWPENPRARAGLTRCIELMVAHEASRGDVAGAEALLAELALPPAELVAQVARLRQEQQAREARDARYRGLERERDWGRFAPSRAAFFAVLAGLTVLSWRLARVRFERAGRSLTPGELTLYAGGVLLGLIATLAVARKRVFGNAVNRQLTVGLVVTVAMIVAHRASWLLDAPRTATVVAGDMMICAAAAATGGLTLARWLGWIAPVFLAGAVAARLVPRAAGLCFGFALLIALLIALFAWERPRPSGSP